MFLTRKEKMTADLDKVVLWAPHLDSEIGKAKRLLGDTKASFTQNRRSPMCKYTTGNLVLTEVLCVVLCGTSLKASIQS